MDFIRHYLCCCVVSAQDHDREQHQIQPDHEIPNERTELIPREGEGSIGYDAIDQQKLERRLGGIVRSKESKMVKIGYTHPFNLHNKDALGSETTISRSNSNSGSSFVHHNHPHHANTVSSHLAQGYSNAYASSSSEHVGGYHYAGHHHHQQYEPSPLSHSRSASRDPEDDSRPNVPYADQQEIYYDETQSVIAEQPRAGPILNVRLVTRGDLEGKDAGEGRGRKRERPGRAGSGHHEVPTEFMKDEHDLRTPTEVKPGSGSEVRAGEPVEAKPLPVKKRTFVLDDVDSIAVSWGD